MDHTTPSPSQYDAVPPGVTPYAATAHGAMQLSPAPPDSKLHDSTHSSPARGTTSGNPTPPPDPTPPGPAEERSTRAERQARAEWLVTELGRLAARADDPHDQARLRRTADSLVRLATAFRS